MLATAAVVPANASARLLWSGPTLIDNQGIGLGFAGVSCASADLCVAVDLEGNVVVSTDPTGGPAAWTRTNVDASLNSFTGVSCPSVSLCVAVDNAGNVVTSTNPIGGAHAWRVSHVDNNSYSLSAVSCPSKALCVAVDSAGSALTSTNPTGGAGAWTTTPRIAPTGYHEGLYGVSCASVSLCVAVGDWGIQPYSGVPAGNIVTSTNPTGGAGAWTTANIGGNGYLAGVSCASASLCLAVHGSGQAAASTNPTGGASAWTTTNIDGSNLLSSASCPSVSLCVAVDLAGNVLVSTDPTGGAATWSTTHVDSTGEALTSISCPTTVQCFAVDSGGSLIVGDVGPIAPSVAQIKAQLLNEIIPKGKAANIAALLKHGGFRLLSQALLAGKATIAWYYLPKRTHIKTGKPKWLLIATGTKTFPKPGKARITIRLTTTGNRLLKHAKRFTITAKATFTLTHKTTIVATWTFTLTR